MAAPKGSKNALGNRGGGRKSAYKEKVDAEFLINVWEGKVSPKQLQKKIASMKYGAKHVFALKCLQGDKAALQKIADKLYANQNVQEVKFTDQTDRPDPDKLTKKEREEIMRVTGFLKPSEQVKKDV